MNKCVPLVIFPVSWLAININWQQISRDGDIFSLVGPCGQLNAALIYQGFQSTDSIYAINLLISGLFTVNTMWTDCNVLSKM